MKASDVKQPTKAIKPVVEGNKVFMAQLPEYVEGEKGDLYKIKFVDKEDRVFEKQYFDPFSSDPSKVKPVLVEAGFKRFFDIYRAVMTTENYNSFADIDFKDLKAAIATGNKMVATDWNNTELTILIGNSFHTGYSDLPTFGDFISSKYAELELEYPHSQLSLEYVANPTVARKPKAGATPDKENSAPKGNVNDDV